MFFFYIRYSAADVWIILIRLFLKQSLVTFAYCCLEMCNSTR